MSNYKTVFFTLGVLQIVLGLSMIVPVLVQLIFDQIDAGFIGSMIVTIVFGFLFFISNYDHDKKIIFPRRIPQKLLLTIYYFYFLKFFLVE